MIATLRKKFAVIAATLALAVVPAVALPSAAFAAADIQGQLNCGANLTVSGSGGCAVEDGSQKLDSIITTVVNVFSVIVAIVAVVMIIFGGFKYITSGGDSGNVSGAKNTIIYAVIGLVVVALAQFIVKFVLNTTTTAGGA